MAGLSEDDEPLYPPLNADEKARHRRQGQLFDARRRQLEQRIVTDPNKFGGDAHVKGSAYTVKSIRAAWAERGVRLADMRQRFRSLEDDDIEAALFHWIDPAKPSLGHEPGECFVADWAGPPRRKICVSRASQKGLTPELWQIAADEFDADGAAFPLPDALDEGFAQILRYIPRYAPHDLVWRDEATGNVVEIHSLTQK
jgi:uncharacterized protein (DUF433 family)